MACRASGMPSAIYDSALGAWEEPNSATATPEVSPQERHIVTGNCMDQAALTGLLCLCCSLFTTVPAGPLSQLHYSPVHRWVVLA